MEGEDDACISVLGVALPPFGFILCVIVWARALGVCPPSRNGCTLILANAKIEIPKSSLLVFFKVTHGTHTRHARPLTHLLRVSKTRGGRDIHPDGAAPKAPNDAVDGRSAHAAKPREGARVHADAVVWGVIIARAKADGSGREA